MVLDATQLTGWARDGFLVVPDAVAREDCERLKDRATEIVDAFDPSVVSVSTTHEQERASDEYFLASGDNVSCFFEEDAFEPDGSLRQAKSRSINKIGHAQHDLDDEFGRFSRQTVLADVATDIGFEDPLLLQSMYIFKQPHIGGEVTCHQDATFLITEPASVVGMWFAIEDATLDNGCLWVETGGHRGPLRRRFVRDADAGGTRFEALDDTPLPEPGDRSLVPIEAEQGALVLLHGLLPHRSDANRSDRSRHVYTLHLIERSAEYPADNWLRRSPDNPLRGF